MDTEELQSNQKHIRIHIFFSNYSEKRRKFEEKTKKTDPTTPKSRNFSNLIRLWIAVILVFNTVKEKLKVGVC